MRRPAQLNVPAKGGSIFKFSSTLFVSIGRLKVRTKALYSEPIFCFWMVKLVTDISFSSLCKCFQVNSRTRTLTTSPWDMISPITKISSNINAIATRSKGWKKDFLVVICNLLIVDCWLLVVITNN